MTAKKPQNSILVLATLGVYLGLLLAGATPQVLAQAAMTRPFDVKDEIEVKDDLDTKPDAEKAIAAYVTSVAEILAVADGLSKTHPELVAAGRYELNGFVDRGDSSSAFRYRSQLPSSVFSGKYSSPIIGLVAAFPQFVENDRKDFHLGVIVDGDRLEFKLGLEVNDRLPVDPSVLAGEFSTALKARAQTSLSSAESDLISNSEIVYKGSLIYFVTNLPRGSLDPLPISSAK